jgi:hypothetical protein
MDRAAVSAVRQWKFVPVKGAIPGQPLWGQVKLLFAPPHAPSAEMSVRRSLEKLIAAFPVTRGNDSATNAGESIEAEVGHLGPIHSVRFLGFVDHGIALDRSDSWEAQGPPQPESTHWEVYDVEQNRGSSVWAGRDHCTWFASAHRGRGPMSDR